MMKFFKKNSKNKKILTRRSRIEGFTLVETLVAVSIFSMSVVISMTVLSNGISNTIYAKNKTIATYLAQEGIEYVRNMRDTYLLYDIGGSQSGWGTFTSRFTTSGAMCHLSNGCYFGDLPWPGAFYDPNQPIIGITVQGCSTACPVLLLDANTGKYNYTVGTPSGFTRIINVTLQGGGEELKVTSTVSVNVGSRKFSVTLYETLFDWIEQ